MLLSNYTEDGILIKEISNGSEKKVRVKCEYCEKERVIIFHNYTLSQRKRGNDLKTPCRKCILKNDNPNKEGRKWTEQQREKMTERIGFAEKHFSWKGGTYKGSDGYNNVYIGKKKYKKEHRLLIEKKLNRELSREEVVHHIDCDKSNNSFDNLMLCENELEHKRIHNSGFALFGELFAIGIIEFDFDKKEYKVAHNKLRELLEHPEEDNQQPSQQKT